jgi:hypothetical protein
MQLKLVKDLMVPLHEYPNVSEQGTLADAVIALDKSQNTLPAGFHPHRAVLVISASGEVIGKIGQLAFLKALEPGYNALGDLQLLSKSGLSAELIDAMKNNLNFWNDSLENICSRALTIRVKEVMHPFSESVDENASLTEAIHAIVMGQTLSLLVRREQRITGIIRLSDLFSEVTATIKVLTSKSNTKRAY